MENMASTSKVKNSVLNKEFKATDKECLYSFEDLQLWRKPEIKKLKILRKIFYIVPESFS
jgi:hypothetical protein